jgi:hypothetical protein
MGHPGNPGRFKATNRHAGQRLGPDPGGNLNGLLRTLRIDISSNTLLGGKRWGKQCEDETGCQKYFHRCPMHV